MGPRSQHIPTWAPGKWEIPGYKPYITWVFTQESLENTINTMGTLLGWYTQLSLDRMCNNIPPQNAPRFVEYQTGPQICHNSCEVYSYIVHIQLVYKCMLKMYMYNVCIYIHMFVCISYVHEYKPLHNDTVDGRNPANQLRLVVYLSLFTTGFIHPGWFSRRISEASTVVSTYTSRAFLSFSSNISSRDH